MLIRLKVAFFVCCSYLISLPLQASVEVSLNNTTYRYADNPRLAEVLAPLALADDWYWPQSKLFRTNTRISQALRNEIVSMLQRQPNSKHGSVYNDMSDQMIMWDLADRIPVSVDFELARISAQHNPRFENGQYHIILSTRPESLYIFGAVHSALNLPYSNNTCVEKIVAKMSFSALADKNVVYAISAKGEVTKIPIAYWNSQCTLLKPGSMLFVPLHEGLLAKRHRIINNKITELAVNRIAVQ